MARGKKINHHSLQVNFIGSNNFKSGIYFCKYKHTDVEVGAPLLDKVTDTPKSHSD